MRSVDVIDSLWRLKDYCERERYKGWDVGDSIESPLLSKTVLGKSPFIRFFVQQLTGHRLGYFNVRPLLRIPKLLNAKGVALFLNGYCNLYDILKNGYPLPDDYSLSVCLRQIEEVASLLISLRSKGISSSGWGYPTGWQGRLHFFFPPHTPTVVASSFAVEALAHAYAITREQRYRDEVLETARFVMKDLHRTPYKSGFLFSYSPYPGNDSVYNASLLGARILLRCYDLNGDRTYKEIAKQAIDTCVEAQNPDGSWPYGNGSMQGWIDNFHTGYNLEAIQTYKEITGETIYDDALDRGATFMLTHHFDRNHVPKYYHDRQYPIDIHCCGEIFVVLHKLGLFDSYKRLAEDVFVWTVKHMQDGNGYFYFQKHKWMTNKTPYMRWSNAFMFNALSYLLKDELHIRCKSS